MTGNKWMRCVMALGLLSTTLLSGCVVVVATGCDWDNDPAVWTEETVQLQVESAGLTAMEVRSHNGAVDFAGQPAGSAATVSVRKKAGGSSADDAREAMAAIEVTSERTSSGEQKLGWKWRGTKKSRWVGVVSFSIQAPGAVRFDAETHNGEITVNGVAGDTRVVTHNGAVTVNTSAGKLDVETHNGAITATYNGASVSLETHNGEIRADLRNSGAVRGEMTTNNGAIEVLVGAGTAANVVAETDNGRVSHDAAITVESEGKTRLEGKIGAGGDRLELTTHNGSINIKAVG